MSNSKDSKETSTVFCPKYSAPWFYYRLTIVQAGTAAVFTTFLVTHLSATALASFGGIELTNKTIVLGRVYYQNKFLEPIVVFGSLCGHIIAGIAKRVIKQYWKYKKQDQRKLIGEVRIRVEKTTADETDEHGGVRQKITTKTTTTITGSHITRALVLIGQYHHLTGYLLIPSVLAHALLNRILPRRHFGDSSMINASYVTLSLKKWPRSSYLGLTALIAIGVYHVGSGLPAVYKILKSLLIKKNGEKISESAKKRQRYIRNGIIVSTIGLLMAGILVIGGKIGKDNTRIPLRKEYLKVYGQIYPQSWVREL
ncbi:8033_t:CDS:1 [Diversispora eburnea]|uniref:8033_t:CDS:1 n=1 Tax=Diversispora eburnea TaxID=1213867 RepID=A0A9N8VUJ3_9GLOM|nr:8033_t:CDS:1 [Diversispora eburnea]